MAGEWRSYTALCQVRKNRRITPSGHRSNDTALTLRHKDNGRLPPPGKESACPARLRAHRGSPGRGELPSWGAPFLGCCLIAGDEPQVKVERPQRSEDIRPLGAMSACHDRGCEEGQGGVRELSRPSWLNDLADPPGFPRRGREAPHTQASPAMRPSPGPGVLRDGPQVLAWGVRAGDLRSLSGGEPSSPQRPPGQRPHGSPWRARVAAGQKAAAFHAPPPRTGPSNPAATGETAPRRPGCAEPARETRRTFP
jgi:hypothetical protein